MKELNKCMGEIKQELKDFPWKDPQAYGLWLAQTYYFVKHSVRLLGLCIARFPDDADAFRMRYSQHIREEYGHEKMCLMDLKEMGMNIEDLEELPETKSFYRSQYFGVDHISSHYLLGYILFLEGIAVHGGKDLYELIKEKHTGPHTFLRVHVEEDPEHLEKAIAQIDALSEVDKENVLESLDLSSTGYRNILRAIKERAQAQQAAA